MYTYGSNPESASLACRIDLLFCVEHAGLFNRSKKRPRAKIILFSLNRSKKRPRAKMYSYSIGAKRDLGQKLT